MPLLRSNEELDVAPRVRASEHNRDHIISGELSFHRVKHGPSQLTLLPAGEESVFRVINFSVAIHTFCLFPDFETVKVLAKAAMTSNCLRKVVANLSVLSF